MTNPEDNARYDHDFRTIVEADDSHDIGLEKFNQRMQEFEKAINKPESTLEDEGFAVESLNHDWPYHDAMLSFSGRLYITGEDTEEVVPESWGEPYEDTNGVKSYLVDDIGLQSMGIIAGFDNGQARLAYAYCFPQEGPEWPDFLAYPGEAIQHYAVPTELAISTRLHSRWPGEMEIVDNLIDDGFVNQKMIRRLRAVSRRLQPMLADQTFRELFVPYINYRLHFDQKWPYLVEANHDILCHDSDGQLKGSFTESDWVVMKLDQPLTLALRQPAIDFVPYEGIGDNYIHPMLFAEMSDPDDEDDGAQLGIPLEHVGGIRSTRVTRTMVERALLGYQAENDLSEAMSQLQIGDEVVVTLANSGPENGHKPPKVIAMEFLEKDIIDFIESIKGPINALYETEEQALEVANTLSYESGNRLVGAGIDQYMLEISGERVMRPRTVNRLPKDFVIEPGTFILQVDQDMPLVPLQHGDTINGVAESFLGVAEPEQDDEGEIIGYRAIPSLIVDISQETKSLLNFANEAPLVEVAAQRRAAIPLDGSVEIKMVSLEKYRDNVRVLKTATTQYRNDPIVRLIKGVSEAFFKEKNDFQEFKQVKKLRKIAERIEQGQLPGGNRAAIEALESMFLKRHVNVFGSLIYPDALETVHDSIQITGLVADISDDIEGVQGLTFVISNSDHDTRYYVPVSGLTRLDF